MEIPAYPALGRHAMDPQQACTFDKDGVLAYLFLTQNNRRRIACELSSVFLFW